MQCFLFFQDNFPNSLLQNVLTLLQTPHLVLINFCKSSCLGIEVGGGG